MENTPPPFDPNLVPQSLTPLREQIDEIDQQIIGLLASRFKVTDQVGVYKAANDLPAVDKTREEAQYAKISDLALANGVDPELARGVLELIISKVVANHQQIAADYHAWQNGSVETPDNTTAQDKEI